MSANLGIRKPLAKLNYWNRFILWLCRSFTISMRSATVVSLWGSSLGMSALNIVKPCMESQWMTLDFMGADSKGLLCQTLNLLLGLYIFHFVADCREGWKANVSSTTFAKAEVILAWTVRHIYIWDSSRFVAYIFYINCNSFMLVKLIPRRLFKEDHAKKI